MFVSVVFLYNAVYELNLFKYEHISAVNIYEMRKELTNIFALFQNGCKVIK